MLPLLMLMLCYGNKTIQTFKNNYELRTLKLHCKKYRRYSYPIMPSFCAPCKILPMVYVRGQIHTGVIIIMHTHRNVIVTVAMQDHLILEVTTFSGIHCSPARPPTHLPTRPLVLVCVPMLFCSFAVQLCSKRHRGVRNGHRA